MTAKLIFFRVFFLCTALFISFVSYAEVDHLNIRGHKKGELVYENASRKYYLATTKNGYDYFVVIHDVGMREKMVDLIFQTRYNLSEPQLFVYSNKELEIFLNHLLPELEKRKSKTKGIMTYHYNANILLENKSSTVDSDIQEEPIFSIVFRKIEGWWDFYRSPYIYNAKTNFVSVDEASQYRKIKSKNISSASEKHKKELKKILDAENTEFAAKVAIKKSQRQLGIVYKSKHFWQYFVGFDEMKDIFEGHFNGVTRKKMFKVYYHSFISQYDTHCSQSLQNPIVVRRFIMERVTSIDGIEQYRENTADIMTKMEQRFSDKYDEYSGAIIQFWKLYGVGKHFQRASGLSQGKSIKTVWLETMADHPEFQMTKFFHYASCDSAMMFQMKENMWRASHGKQSLQAEGIRVKNAENESTPVKETINEKTLYEACIDNGDGASLYLHEKYCACFDNKARTVMTMEELARYSKNFPLYYSEVTSIMEGIGKEDDLWRLYEPHRCRL